MLINTLEEFNKVYVYKTDTEKFGFVDVWEVPEPDGSGIVYGDCESYCLYLKHNIEYFEDWNYWYCKLDGIGHCILVSKDGKNVIDCNIKRELKLDQYVRVYNITELKQYSIFQVFSKFVFGKIVSFFKK